MTQCSSDVTAFNPNSLTAQFQTQNPESSLSDKARSCSSDIDLDLILILDARPLETLSYISSVKRKLSSPPPPLSIHTEWSCSGFVSLHSNKRALSRSLLFRALAKTCWSLQSKPELIRITGMFNLNSGYCSQLEERVAAYLQSRNGLLISETFVKGGVQKPRRFCWLRLIKYVCAAVEFPPLCQNSAGKLHQTEDWESLEEP